MSNAGMLTGRLAKLGAADTVRVVRELCSQLGSNPGSFHGNIWPGNVTLSDSGSAALGAPSSAPASERSADQIEYLAPEFFWDGKGSAAADVYSLGLMLYCGCTGSMPFRDASSRDRSVSLRRRMKGEQIPVPSSVDPALAAVLSKALSYDPAARYVSAADMLSALAGVNVKNAAPVKLGKEKPARGKGKDKAAAAAAGAPGTPGAPNAFGFAGAPGAPGASGTPGAVGGGSDYTARSPMKKARKRKSPLIPILCGVAVVIIAAVVCVLVLTNRIAPAEDEPAAIEATSPPYTASVEPAATDAPMAIDVDEGDTTSSEPAAATAAGSSSIDGMVVTATNDTVYITTTNANLRSGPGIDYDIEETLDADTELQRTGTVNGWSQVQYDGNEYYISNAVVTTDAPDSDDADSDPSDADADASAADDSTSSAGTGTSSTGTGTSSTGTGTSSTGTGTSSTGTGTSSTGTGTSSTGTGTSSTGTGTSSTGTGTGTSSTGTGTSSSGSSTSVSVTSAQGIIIVSSEANLRSGPGTSYSVKTTISGGSALQYTGTTSEWYRVIYNDETMYISKTMASEASDTKTTSAVGVLKIASDANIRSGADTTYTVLGVAKAGTTLSITGIVGSKWYRVSYNNQTGYVNRMMVTVTDFSVVNSMSGTVKLTSDANLRSGPGTNFTILTTGSANSTYTVTGMTDTHWYQISYNNQVAYVAASLATKQ